MIIIKSVYSRTCITAAKVKISVCTKESQETTVYTKSSFLFQDDTLVSFEGLLATLQGVEDFWSYVGKASGMFIFT